KSPGRSPADGERSGCYPRSAGQARLAGVIALPMFLVSGPSLVAARGTNCALGRSRMTSRCTTTRIRKLPQLRTAGASSPGQGVGSLHDVPSTAELITRLTHGIRRRVREHDAFGRYLLSTGHLGVA